MAWIGKGIHSSKEFFLKILSNNNNNNSNSNSNSNNNNSINNNSINFIMKCIDI